MKISEGELKDLCLSLSKLRDEQEGVFKQIREIEKIRIKIDADEKVLVEKILGSMDKGEAKVVIVGDKAFFVEPGRYSVYSYSVIK